MSASNSLLPAYFNTDAEFRTWAQAFHDALTAAGWVNTADTGQINLATVAKPAAGNTAQGYEIWRMADAQQATLPCFMKIEYGSNGAADRPAIWYTVGTASNGSGTLTGQVGTRRQFGAALSKTAGTTLPTYFSGNTDRFSFVCNYDSGGTSFYFAFAVERTADGNGTATADGIITWSTNAGLGPQSQVIPPSPIAVPAAGATSPFISPGVLGDLTSVGVNVSLCPGIWLVGKPFFMRSFGIYKNADITGGSGITVNVSGGTHTYQTFASTGTSVQGQSGTTGGCAMIYE
jgi:hypothetical protein